MKKNNKGFTLAELLIVVAIIAVLVAIAIPIFSTQLEKSKEATDIANVRDAYAELTTLYLTDNAAHSMSVAARQGQDGWVNGNSGYVVVQSNGAQKNFSFNAKTSGNNYAIAITASGVLTIDGTSLAG